MDDPLLSRIDEHMRRSNELVAQIRAEWARSEERYREEVQITREVVRRNELAFHENSRLNAELVERVREIGVDLRELGAEVRAQTEAIFRMLDRFEGGSEPAGA